MVPKQMESLVIKPDKMESYIYDIKEETFIFLLFMKVSRTSYLTFR